MRVFLLMQVWCDVGVHVRDLLMQVLMQVWCGVMWV